ncbi:MAG TPA: Hpt domain-containing protein [Candidatus Binatia bacterium]|nr:Hpt domain-containing protein [Candidatus Binatia bacterium]
MSGPVRCSVDVAELVERVGGERELLREVVAIFLEECPGRMERLNDAIRVRDLVALELAAHSLEGCLSMFAAAEGVRLTKAIARSAESGDYTDVATQYAALGDEVGRIKLELLNLASDSR